MEPNVITLLSAATQRPRGDLLKILSLDQSLSKCAWVLIEDDSPMDWGVIKTGQMTCKKKLKSVHYFETTTQQIRYIVEKVEDIIDKYHPDVVVCEGLALSAIGNQTRALAGLYYCLFSMFYDHDFMENDGSLFVVPPTKVKSVARSLMGVEENPKKGLKIKMDKKIMIELARKNWPEVLEGYKGSGENAGVEDLSDSLHVWRAYTLRELIH